MDRRMIHDNSNNSTPFIQSLNNNEQTRAMDLRKLSSRIICSDNITRQSLNQPIVSVALDDDDQFFQKIKSKIDRDLLSHSRKNYKPNCNYQSTALLKKKRLVDEETENVIKRFKKDISRKNAVQALNDIITVPQSNAINDNRKERCNILTNTFIDKEHVQLKQTKDKNKFLPNLLRTDFRDPSNKYIFQMTSELQKNVLPLITVETTVVQEEYEESLFYTMLLTPPNSNSIDDTADSETCTTLDAIT